MTLEVSVLSRSAVCCLLSLDRRRPSHSLPAPLRGQSVATLRHDQTQELLLLLRHSLLTLLQVLLRYIRLNNIGFVLHVENIITNKVGRVLESPDKKIPSVLSSVFAPTFIRSQSERRTSQAKPSHHQLHRDNY